MLARSGELDYDGAGRKAFKPRLMELVRAVPDLVEKLKTHLRALVAHYVVRALPARARELIDDMWSLVGKQWMRELLSECDEPDVVDTVANKIVEDCDRADIRNRMRTEVLRRVLDMTHDQYAIFLEDPNVCVDWFFEPPQFQKIMDAWATKLLADATVILDENRRRREAKAALIRAEETERARRAEKKQREAEAKKTQRSRKQQLNAEKQRAAKQAKEAKEEARVAKWRIGTSAARAQTAKVPTFSDEDIYPATPRPVSHTAASAAAASAAAASAAAASAAVSTAAVSTAAVSAAVTECRVCMEDVRGCAIALPCGHNQVCDACATALVRDKLLACLQCQQPVCMYMSHEGECLCTSSGCAVSL
jgi:hypothetical protein